MNYNWCNLDSWTDNRHNEVCVLNVIHDSSLFQFLVITTNGRGTKSMFRHPLLKLLNCQCIDPSKNKE
ncbi:hypothetical protein CIPAW_05G225400 [Carya illinoinensis]|uniref:Uncharacterized protein n=1 Tax=Carya illinoinensis TaxID=32201 RepID=A0A8T1QM58_CARIL|nr:hypothetical protein CIPAW_05G225400 [Carya illinoinensis]